MDRDLEKADLLDLTGEAYAALNRRDFDALLAMFGPASVWDVSRWGLGTHAGLDSIHHLMDDWFGSLDDYEVQIEEMTDLGNGVVALVVTQVARLKGGGAMRVRSAPVFVWSGTTIASVTLYPDIEEGRAAAAQAAGLPAAPRSEPELRST